MTLAERRDDRMERIEAGNLARELMAVHGLDVQGWRFEWDHANRRFGCCRPGQKLITLSLPLVLLNDLKQVRDTILHEIAHALAPAGAHHNETWRRIALSIGCNGERCYQSQDVVRPPSRYVYACSVCGTNIPRMKRMRNPAKTWHIPCKKINPTAHMVLK